MKMKMLKIEQLESRDCPSVTYNFLDGMGATLISGTTPGTTLQIGTIAGDVAINGVDSGTATSAVASISLVGTAADNTIDLSQVYAADYSAVTSATATGGVLDDAFILGDNGLPWTIDGNTGSGDSLDYSASSANLTFTVNGSGSGSIGGTAFTSIESITSGSGNDTFNFSTNTASILQSVDAGSGINTLDYTGRTTAVMVSLTAGTSSSIGGGIVGFANVTGGSGNDRITGDAIANVLNGGAGNNVLIGLDGDDTLIGGGGRDVLLGGNGADSLNGGGGDDLLVAGPTAYDTNATAITAISLEWFRMDATYSTRVAHLDGALGGGYNTHFLLNSTTVSDDGTADSLAGGSGVDWFIVSSGDSVSDQGFGGLETKTVV